MVRFADVSPAKEDLRMNLVDFEALPGTARLWIFAADRALSSTELEETVQSVKEGLAAWAAHGRPVTWGCRTVHDQFLLVGVDETHTELSGCSIDHAVHRIQELEEQMGLSFLDHSRVFYREGEAIRTVSRPAFRELAENGMVSGETVVFNNAVATVGEFRDGLWEVPLHRSWHARAFPVRVP